MEFPTTPDNPSEGNDNENESSFHSFDSHITPPHEPIEPLWQEFAETNLERIAPTERTKDALLAQVDRHAWSTPGDTLAASAALIDETGETAIDVTRYKEDHFYFPSREASLLVRAANPTERREETTYHILKTPDGKQLKKETHDAGITIVNDISAWQEARRSRAAAQDESGESFVSQAEAGRLVELLETARFFT